MKKKNIFVLIFLLSVVYSEYAHSQDQRATKINLTTTIDSLRKLSWDHIYTNPDSTIFYSRIQYDIALKNQHKDGILNALYQTGYAYDELKYFDKAAEYYYKSLDILQTYSFDEPEKKRAKIYQCLGLTYEKTYNYNMALEFYNESLALAKQKEIPKLISDLNLNIGIIYDKKKEKSLAIKHYNIALEGFYSLNDIENIAKINNLIGIFNNSENEYKIAKTHYKKAIDLTKKNNTVDRAYYISNLGENYFLQNQYDSAKIYYHQALEISKKYNDMEKMKWIYSNIGDVHFKEKNYREAIAWYQKSIELGNPEAIDAELQRAYQNIARAYDAVEDYKLASQFKSSFIAQANKVAETKERLAEQNAQYRMKEVEWQRQLADKETLLAQLKSWLNSGLAVFGLFIIVFGYVSWRLYLHYTVHKEMKRILMTPISEELERLDRKNERWDDDSYV